jgi:hypothetical protein
VKRLSPPVCRQKSFRSLLSWAKASGTAKSPTGLAIEEAEAAERLRATMAKLRIEERLDSWIYAKLRISRTAA